MESTSTNPLLEVGCDYITVTAASCVARKHLIEFGKYLVRDAVRGGAKQTVCRTLGYKGEAATGVSWGQRLDGALLRATSHTAAEHWNQIFDVGERCTRFDVQITLRTKHTPHEVMSAVWKKNPGWTTGKGRRSKVKKVVGPNGIESLFVGARQSETFFRMYDKGIESGDDWYRLAVRAELELKGDYSQQYAEQLTRNENAQRAMLATVCEFCERRLRVSMEAFHLRWSASDKIICHSLRRTASSYIKELRWLGRSVRPCIERLVRAGLRRECLSALGLPQDSQTSEELITWSNMDHTTKEGTA